MKKQAFNPYLPSWEYIPDGEPYVFGDRVYVYGSHDYFNGYVFCMGDYVCWSAPVDDLGNWRYEGVIYPKTADPLNPEGKMCLYAPDVTVGPDGRYYLYYVLDKVPVVSVAVCDTPAGKYEFYGYVHYEDGTRLGEKEGDEPQFDPGVLTEGDVTYLYTGFCGKGDKSRTGAMATVLGVDMLTIREAPVFVAPGCEYGAGTGFEGHEFFEAPSIRKVGDTYYFVYSSILMHELCYATSRILLGTLSMAELLSAIVICTSIPTSRQICQQLTVPIITEVLCRSERTGTFFITGIPIIPGTADRDVLKSCRLCRTAVFHR